MCAAVYFHTKEHFYRIALLINMSRSESEAGKRSGRRSGRFGNLRVLFRDIRETRLTMSDVGLQSFKSVLNFEFLWKETAFVCLLVRSISSRSFPIFPYPINNLIAFARGTEEPLATTADLTHYYFTEKLINMSTR